MGARVHDRISTLSQPPSLGTMHFLETSGANALISRAISYILGSLFAYYTNSFVTFSGNRSAAEKLRASSSTPRV